MLIRMTDVTQILSLIAKGDPSAANQLLPLVYNELRQLAAQRLAHEAAGQTLQPTALVHEAYVRLVDAEQQQRWDSRGHFFSAAAEAMRRILVDSARRKGRLKRGGDLARRELNETVLAEPEISHDLLALDEALERFAEKDPAKCELVKLRFFAGLTIPQAAEALGISTSTADRHWVYARAWLFRAVSQGDQSADE